MGILDATQRAAQLAQPAAQSATTRNAFLDDIRTDSAHSRGYSQGEGKLVLPVLRNEVNKWPDGTDKKSAIALLNKLDSPAGWTADDTRKFTGLRRNNMLAEAAHMNAVFHNPADTFEV